MQNQKLEFFSISHYSKSLEPVLSRLNEKIAIIHGEPYSINSEIIYKSWLKLNQIIRKKFLLLEVRKY